MYHVFGDVGYRCRYIDIHPNKRTRYVYLKSCFYHNFCVNFYSYLYWYWFLKCTCTYTCTYQALSLASVTKVSGSCMAAQGAPQLGFKQMVNEPGGSWIALGLDSLAPRSFPTTSSAAQGPGMTTNAYSIYCSCGITTRLLVIRMGLFHCFASLPKTCRLRQLTSTVRWRRCRKSQQSQDAGQSKNDIASVI